MKNFGMNIADMYAGLMMIFLFIAISTLSHANQSQNETDAVKKDIISLQQSREWMIEEIYNTLNDEFESDLQRWNAVIDPDLTIRFRNPDILFVNGSSELEEGYKVILSNFFPRYLSIVKQFGSSISSVSIDGHTSTLGWVGCVEDCSYFRNMLLSQERSANTLSECWKNVEKPDQVFIQTKFVATGLSYSDPIYKVGGCPTGARTGLTCNVIDEEQSKRVEFTIKLDNAQFINSLEGLVKN